MLSMGAKQVVNLDNGFLIFISDGDVTVNFETSNGHTVAIGEETIQEENIVKASGDNGTSSEKASALEGKKEDQKGKGTRLSQTVFHLLKILTCYSINTNML